MVDEEEKTKLKELISSGSEIAGAAVGGALGFVAAGPAGGAIAAAGGAMIGKAFNKIGAEIHDRFLGPREQVRVGATTAFAIEKIKEKLEDDNEPRSDGFFDGGDMDRSSADEVFEGALLKSKAAYEEKKLKHIGLFVGNIAFDSALSAERASYYLNLVERLTYRQLCLLTIINSASQFGLRVEQLTNKRGTPEGWGVLQEINELYSLSLLRQLNEKGENDLFWGLGAIRPGRMALTRLGLDLVKYFELNLIPQNELKNIAAMLR